MHSNMSSDWTFVQLCYENGLKNPLTDITIGDLPPKSPEFCNMLPSLRSSPIFLSRTHVGENNDSFHVVPCNADMECTAENDTYGNFLKQLQRDDARYENENFLLSPQDFEVPTDFTQQEDSNGLFESDDLQIYLTNEISPTPVDSLYSTLQDEQSPKTFAFPCFDENQRLENFEFQATSIGNSESGNVTSLPSANVTSPEVNQLFLRPNAQHGPQKRKSDGYTSIEIAKKRAPTTKTQTKRELEKPTHNDIERQRRNDMKGRFDALKTTVPEIENVERTPKILILSKATEFIKKLHRQEKQLDIEKDKERQRNRLLLEKLVQLTNV